MSILFTVTEDQIILRTAKGIYKQTKIARRGQYAYAQIGGGFVMLYANGTTSHPTIQWIELEAEKKYRTGSLGRLLCDEPLEAQK
jgi:hypothetical protein